MVVVGEIDCGVCGLDNYGCWYEKERTEMKKEEVL